MIKNKYQNIPDFRQIRTFLAVAEAMSFRGAAEKLHIAQPALSRQIAQLEESIGCALFDRSKRRIQLTRAGQYLYQALPKTLDLLYDTLELTHKVAMGQYVKLRFGYSSAAMSSFLPDILKTLHETISGCEFRFSENTSDELIGDVIAGRLDAAFILYRPNNPLLKTIPIKADRTGLILPEHHPLAEKRIVDLEDLQEETLILFPRKTNPVMYDEIIFYCKQAGFSPHAIIETAPRSTAIGLVAAGQGIATIADSLKHTCVRGTTYRPLQQPTPMINYSCIVRKDTVGVWLDFLVDYIHEHLFDDKV